MSYTRNINELKNIGYTKLDNLYSKGEINDITNYIEAFNIANNYIQTANQLFAIRQLLKVIPGLKKALSNKNLIQLLNLHFESNYFLTKAIYFDKPPNSNWFVPYHQDLSISVTTKADIDGYSNWTTKKDVYGVQPPINILENTITIRIHLDDTTKDNGALKVVPKSHSNGVIRKGSKYWNMDKQDICEINKGGVMLMKPLLLHASDRTINNQRRRVIHLEFNSNELPNPIKWYEYEKFIS
ncbi:phytanoyl-CoA dioxygenase family protein [Winogradskyella echinorum]|uniref:Phytanoyl-CoA dioxygenase family protein n=1 Tax=Winogradskyella echinorum TaxID=538189 RepID=A0ABR6Y514_9FLAO|nr:phytanoyl-CoA dioxygenase family protein [Winogradskyella echinorum]MBC3847840.1 phytanoyl-CoA dioxygenase family protein [Winogradskyella echinorum]MBC5752188.1 phytanoyl-CoA dioxygenase family protein [Winogradskyella echinorum]